MFCTKCGQQLPEDALFCSKCGAKVQLFESSDAVSNLAVDVEIDSLSLVSDNAIDDIVSEKASFIGEEPDTQHQSCCAEINHPIRLTPPAPAYPKFEETFCFDGRVKLVKVENDKDDIHFYYYNTRSQRRTINFDYASSVFCYGLAIVRRQGKYGYIFYDEDSQELILKIRCILDAANEFRYKFEIKTFVAQISYNGLTYYLTRDNTLCKLIKYDCYREIPILRHLKSPVISWLIVVCISVWLIMNGMFRFGENSILGSLLIILGCFIGYIGQRPLQTDGRWTGFYKYELKAIMDIDDLDQFA